MADYDESSYWDQYDSADYVENMVVVQDPYTKPSRYRDILPNSAYSASESSGNSSYWSKYTESRNTGAQDTPQEPTGQEMRRVLVLPDRLAAMSLADKDESTGNESTDPQPTALEDSLKSTEPTLLAKVASAPAPASAAATIVEVLSSPLRVPQLSDGEDSEEIEPIDSPSGPCFQGVNPLALAARLGFLKSQLDQAEELLA
ncbi:hypothetical protein DL89DRAFT_296438 [Linderina pennispora]|uniref:Uncharacterized protein n=1 Tax=Linderina pennispora TaxID=61395 RepID=A0A1Y1VVB7_9FUNG|nr:uncharacterized protein DL89DRAFT_296438 [Linderina pennispora]ORX65238.1 hypothetical protein DL89DRAFT_296438 [Linderina pennispora]